MQSRDGASTAEAVFAQICELETRHDLLQYTIDGWCVWPLLRFEVALLLANVKMANVDSLRQGLAQRVTRACGDVVALVGVRHKRHVVKTYTSGLLEAVDGFYKDIWLDDLLMEIGSYFKIEMINNPAFIPRRAAAFIKTDLTTTFFDLIAGVLGRVGGPTSVKDVARRMSACLRDESALSPLTADAVAFRLRRFHWLKQLYRWLLKRISPEYLLVADPGELALVAAAKERGIRVLEFQHGINDRYHSRYSWTAYGLKYKRRMPIPDRLLLYGEHWKNELEGSGFWQDALRVVGSLRVDQYRRFAARAVAGEGIRLVFTTQGVEVERTIAFFVDFLTAAKEQRDLRLCIKLHPIYDPDKRPYEAAFSSDRRVQIFLASEGPSTFELLAQAQLHLSISSASHYDALGLGVPTVILPFAGHEIVGSLHGSGHALLARTPLDLLEIVMRWREYRVPPEVREYYFKSGALENMKQELGALEWRGGPGRRVNEPPERI